MKLCFVTDTGEDTLTMDDLTDSDGYSANSTITKSGFSQRIDVRCRPDLSSHKIVFAGTGSIPECLQQYARWARRSILSYAEISSSEFDKHQPPSLLIVSPENDPVWDELVRLLFDGMFSTSAIFFLPYRSEVDLKMRLVRGVILADQSSMPPLSVATVSLQSFRISECTSPSRTALLFHSRPYCGRTDQRGIVTGICSSPDGPLGYCYGGHPCLFESGARQPIEAINAPIAFLNGCSTALPPIPNLPFPSDSLLGYRLYKQTSGIVLGNLGLGPAESWELAYMDAQREIGADLVAQIRSLNRVRENLGYQRAFRLVAFGDGALWGSSPAETGGNFNQESLTVRWEQSSTPLWAKISKEMLPAGWKESGLSMTTNQEQAALIETLFCLDDPASNYLLLIAENTMKGVLWPLTIELRVHSDSYAPYIHALTDAIQGMTAIMSQGDGWDLHQALTSASDVLRSEYQLRLLHRLTVPSISALRSFEASLQLVLRYISQRTMELYLHLLKSGTVDLGNLYGQGIPQCDDFSGTRECPICGVLSWDRGHSIHGLDAVRLLQLQCALCSIVYETPANVVIRNIEIQPTLDGIKVTVTIHNTAMFPVFLSSKWHAEANAVPGSLTYETMDNEFATDILDASEAQSFSFESNETFLRVLHLYFAANGHVGFVQIKDAEPARNRRRR